MNTPEKIKCMLLFDSSDEDNCIIMMRGYDLIWFLRHQHHAYSIFDKAWTVVCANPELAENNFITP